MRISGATAGERGAAKPAEQEATGLESLSLDLKPALKPGELPGFTLHESPDGELTAIADLDQDPIKLAGVTAGLESLVEPKDEDQKMLMDIPLNVSRFNGVYRFGTSEKEMPKLFVVNLSGNCGNDLDYILHIMHYADETITIKLVVSTDDLFSRGILDLIGAINSTKAKVEVHISYIGSMYDLLLMTTKAKVVCEMSQMIQPPIALFYGSHNNVETSSAAIKQHVSTVLTKLLNIGVLTEEDVKNLQDNRKPVVINKTKLNK